MQQKSELEQFLASTSAVGQIDSQGAFTVGGEEALRKIATYQLPFAGAWAVKIIQSIVVTQGDSPIRVDLTATEIRFYFVGADFTLDEFSAAFYTPEPSPNRALRHLLSGLWPVGLKERWGFQIAFARQTETLIWDGTRMNRFESPLARDCTCISIAPLRQKTALSWVAGVAMSGSRNAELLLALGRSCYVCPQPLTVDGRRIDSLQRAEHQGWGKERYPLIIDFAAARLPELRLPPGTFRGVTKGIAGTSLLDDGAGWKQIAEKRMKNLPARESASLAFILCVNMKTVGSGKQRTWEESDGPSNAYWVLDGAVVGTDKLLPRASHCSLGCFLSAQDLQTDLSTFHLVQSPELLQRLVQARRALAEAMKSTYDGHFDEMIHRGKLFQGILGGLLIVGGVACLWASPLAGFLAMAGGGAIAVTGGSKEATRVQSARSSIHDLTSQLRGRTY